MKRLVAKSIALIVAGILAIAAPVLAANWEGASAKIKRSVQRVDMTGQDYFGNTVHGTCTAFSINDFRDYFLTAAHCFGGNITVGGHPARVILMDTESDLMVLIVPESGEVPEVRPAKPRDCKDGTKATTCQGEEVAAMGYGFGGKVPLLKTGNVAYSDVAIPEWGFGPSERMLLSGFSYIPGMSGGPVFNRDGRIVGIVQWGDGENYVGGGRTLEDVMKKTAQYWGVNDNKR